MGNGLLSNQLNLVLRERKARKELQELSEVSPTLQSSPAQSSLLRWCPHAKMIAVMNVLVNEITLNIHYLGVPRFCLVCGRPFPLAVLHAKVSSPVWQSAFPPSPVPSNLRQMGGAHLCKYCCCF